MNLFYSPSLSEFNTLLEQCHTNSPFNILVDYDGEVIIDQKCELPDFFIEKYKFYFKRFRILKQIFGNRLGKPKNLSLLYSNLIFCWDNNVRGQVDFERISDLQKEMRFREIVRLHEFAYPISINVRV